MKKKLSILAVVILLVVLAAGLWACFRPRTVGAVVGNVPPQDVTEIMRLVKQDFGRRIFPGFSSKSFAGLPGNARNYFQYETLEIDGTGNSNIAYVAVRMPAQRTNPQTVSIFRMIKKSGVWSVDRVYPSVPVWQKTVEEILEEMATHTNNPANFPRWSPTQSLQRAPAPPAANFSFPSLASNKNLVTLELDLSDHDRVRTFYSGQVYPSIPPAATLSIINFVPKH